MRVRSYLLLFSMLVISAPPSLSRLFVGCITVKGENRVRCFTGESARLSQANPVSAFFVRSCCCRNRFCVVPKSPPISISPQSSRRKGEKRKAVLVRRRQSANLTRSFSLADAQEEKLNKERANFAFAFRLPAVTWQN